MCRVFARYSLNETIPVDLTPVPGAIRCRLCVVMVLSDINIIFQHDGNILSGG